MAKSEHLPLYVKLFHLNKYLYERVENFPKHYRYTLGESILSFNWKCMDLVIETNAFLGEKKRLGILSLSITFDCFKVRLRMAQEIGLLSQKQYSHIQAFFIKEIGEMIGGWLKWGNEKMNKNERNF